MAAAENNDNVKRSRVFGWQRHYRAISGVNTSRDFGSQLSGSNTVLSSLTGSTQNLLSPSNVLNLQEDAKYKRISSEVMKHRLYESVVHSSRRRRFSTRSPTSSSSSNDVMAFVRTMRSMPVSPSHSGAASPTEPSSMTSSRRTPFRMFLSRGATPRALSPEREESGGEDDTACLGLASVLRPVPRVIRANKNDRMTMSMSDDITESFSIYVPSRNEMYKSMPSNVAEVSEVDSDCNLRNGTNHIVK